MKYTFEQIATNSTTKKKPEESDRFHYIGLEHLDSGNLFVSRFGSDVAPIGEKLLMKKGDVLFGKRRAYQKKVAIAPFDGIFSAHGMVLRPKEEVVCKEYFPFFLSSDTFLNEAIRISVGSLSPTINWGDLKKLEFELPPIDEQRELADLLWAAYELKESYKKLLAATDEMVKAKFVNMLSLCSEHRRLKDITLYIGRGKSPQYVEKSNIVVLNQACIYWNRINFQNVKYQNTDKSENKKHLQNCDILLNSTGTGTLGRCNIFYKPVDDNVYISDSHVTVITANQAFIIPEILAKYLSLAETQNEIYSKCVGGSTNQIELSKEKLKEIKIPILPKYTQEELCLLFKQANVSKTTLLDTIEKLELVMKSLLP